MKVRGFSMRRQLLVASERVIYSSKLDELYYTLKCPITDKYIKTLSIQGWIEGINEVPSWRIDWTIVIYHATISDNPKLLCRAKNAVQNMSDVNTRKMRLALRMSCFRAAKSGNLRALKFLSAGTDPLNNVLPAINGGQLRSIALLRRLGEKTAKKKSYLNAATFVNDLGVLYVKAVSSAHINIMKYIEKWLTSVAGVKGKIYYTHALETIAGDQTIPFRKVRKILLYLTSCPNRFSKQDLNDAFAAAAYAGNLQVMRILHRFGINSVKIDKLVNANELAA